MITIHNRLRTIAIDHSWVRLIVGRILACVNYSDFDIGILFTNNITIRRYNRLYRHKNKPTDILSFSYHHNLKPGKRIHPKTEEDKNLGDLILSLEYIKKEAEKQNSSLEERVKILLIHGICHLLGYDHETDADWRSMRAKEAYILRSINSSK